MRCWHLPCDFIFLLNLQKEKEEGKHKERRPFDRSVDLQTSKLDEAQKKVILKKAQLLNDRFASGQSKFLWSVYSNSTNTDTETFITSTEAGSTIPVLSVTCHRSAAKINYF